MADTRKQMGQDYSTLIMNNSTLLMNNFDMNGCSLLDSVVSERLFC